MKVTSAQDLIAKFPERVIESAVHGMLPKTRMGEKMKLRLKAYAGTAHPHEAQNQKFTNFAVN